MGDRVAKEKEPVIRVPYEHTTHVKDTPDSFSQDAVDNTQRNDATI